jgi:hypothetical protein
MFVNNCDAKALENGHLGGLHCTSLRATQVTGSLVSSQRVGPGERLDPSWIVVSSEVASDCLRICQQCCSLARYGVR